MDANIIKPEDSQPENSAPRFVERRGRPRVIDQVPEPEISFVEIWRVLQKRRLVIATTTVVIFALALLYTFSSTPRYRATSVLEFNKENSDALPLEDGAARLGGAGAMDYTVTQQTQVNAMESDTLALQVAHELSLEKRAEFTGKSALDYFHYTPDEARLPLEKAPFRRARFLKAWHRNLRIEPVSGTRMITIQFMNPDRDVSAAIVNTLVNDYMEQYFRIRYSATVQASDWLSKQLDDLKAEVSSSQQRLVDYQEKAGILGIDENHNIVMQRLEAINQQYTNAQANRILTETVWQLAKTGNPELLSGLVSPSVSTGAGSMPNSLALIETLRARQNELKVQYADATAKFGTSYPKLVELQTQLNETNATIQTEISNLAGRAQNDYLAAKQTEDALRASLENQKAEANKMNNSAVQYTVLKHEVEASRDLYDGLLKKLKEAGVLASLRATNIVVVDPARPADRPARPIVPLNIALGLFAGVIAGIGGAFVAENMDETIASPEDTENACNVPSLGFVPRWKGHLAAAKGAESKALLAPGTGAVVITRPHSQAAEAYRTLRTAIMQSMRRDQSNVILVTSALPEEGKSTTSLNCAAALAQQGANVLLVEADMRRPGMSRQLNLAGLTGLSSLISGEGMGNLPLKVPSVPKLSVIPGGPKPAYPAEMLGSPRMDALIRRWRSEYDYIVIDTPPVLSVTDAAVLAPHCDAVLLVVRAGVTSKKSLVRVRDIFARNNTRVLGTIVNAFDVRSTDYRAYYGYSSTEKLEQSYCAPESN